MHSERAEMLGGLVGAGGQKGAGHWVGGLVGAGGQKGAGHWVGGLVGAGGQKGAGHWVGGLVGAGGQKGAGHWVLAATPPFAPAQLAAPHRRSTHAHSALNHSAHTALHQPG